MVPLTRPVGKCRRITRGQSSPFHSDIRWIYGRYEMANVEQREDGNWQLKSIVIEYWECSRREMFGHPAVPEQLRYYSSSSYMMIINLCHSLAWQLSVYWSLCSTSQSIPFRVKGIHIWNGRSSARNSRQSAEEVANNKLAFYYLTFLGRPSGYAPPLHYNISVR